MAERDQSIIKHEAKQIIENSEPAKNEGHVEEPVAAGGGAEKQWPGWPGENVFRMIVPDRKVARIVGHNEEFVKKAVEETRARIKILGCLHGTSESVVIISGTEKPDSALPPAVDCLLKVHKRFMDRFNSDFDHIPSSIALARKVSTNLLVPAFQAGNLIGKEGATIKYIQEAASCAIRVLGADALPVYALHDDRVVEIIGHSNEVHKAVELIAFQLRKFLVDRSVIPFIEVNMQRGNHHGDRHAKQQMKKQLEAPLMPLPMKKQAYHAINAYGRDFSISDPAPPSPQYPPFIVTHMIKVMQIPLWYAVAVIGITGDIICKIRRESGAFITIEVTRGVPDAMTVKVHGTPSHVQTAQQLIQNHVAEAPAPPQPQPSEPRSVQGYKAYVAARKKRRFDAI